MQIAPNRKMRQASRKVGRLSHLAVGRSMEEALNIIEEIEDEAKLFLLLGDRGIAMTKAQQNALPSHGLRF